MDPFEELRAAVARGAATRAADHAAGHARIGGLWARPDYLRSYLAASRILVREARSTNSFNELAVACAYQQRHVLELALKSLIEMFHIVANDDAEIARIKARTKERPVTSTTPPSDEVDRLTRTHDLTELLGYLCAAHQRECDDGVNYRKLPDDLASLVADISAIEQQQPSRLRYPTVFASNAKRHESSFEDEIVVPVERLQERLESIIDELFGDEDYNKPSDSLGRQLGDVMHGQTQELYSLEAEDPDE